MCVQVDRACENWEGGWAGCVGMWFERLGVWVGSSCWLGDWVARLVEGGVGGKVGCAGGWRGWRRAVASARARACACACVHACERYFVFAFVCACLRQASASVCASVRMAEQRRTPTVIDPIDISCIRTLQAGPPLVTLRCCFIWLPA